MTHVPHKYEEEWKKISEEAQKDFDAGHPSFFKSLEEIKNNNTKIAYRLISAAIIEFRGTNAMPEEHVKRIMMYTGRAYGPAVIYELDQHQVIDPKAYTTLVPDAWSIAEFPGTSLRTNTWRKLWKKAGFTINGKPAPLPAEPVTVYRASWPKYKHHMSWTDNLEIAKRFFRVGYRTKQHLYQTTAQPKNLLAYMHERDESEWIVDTRKLIITEIK